MKRLLGSTTNLTVNSTLRSVAVPYFRIDAFEWVKDPSTIPQHQIDLTMSEDPGRNNPFFTSTLTVALIPDDGWGPATNTTTFPSPKIISETRTLHAVYSHTRSELPTTTCPSEGFFGGLPCYVSIYPHVVGDFTNCVVFARVTYTAGAAICETCRLSGLTVVQPDTAVQVVEDLMTAEALALMPLVGPNMGLGGISVPPSTNIIQYIADILPRSYGAFWNALPDYLSPSTDTTKLATDVMIPIPVLEAAVVHWRVYLWLALNLMLTLSGLLFIVVQYHCENTLVVDTGIAVLLLDTQRVLERDRRALSDLSQLTKEDSQIGFLRLRKENDHKYVEVEKPLAGELDRGSLIGQVPAVGYLLAEMVASSKESARDLGFIKSKRFCTSSEFFISRRECMIMSFWMIH